MVDFPEPMSPVSSVFRAFASSDQTRWSNVPQSYSSRRVSRNPLRISVMLCLPLASGAPPASPFPLHCVAFPRRSSLAPQSRQRRAPPARSCFGLLAGDQRGVFREPCAEVGEPLTVDEGLEDPPYLIDRLGILRRAEKAE